MTQPRIVREPDQKRDPPICVHCDEPVTTPQRDKIIGGPFHDECWTRMIIGGINHQRGLCTCCGGSEPPDPPHWTKRQAAIAAAAFFEGSRKARE